MTTTTIAARPRYETLGTYRFVLAFFVFYGHLTFMVVRHEPSSRLNLENVGVALFFLVSGYIIFSAYENFYRGRAGSYLVNRLVRIYPAFWLVYFVTLYPVLTSSHSEVQDYNFWHVVSDATIMGNYLQFSTLAPMQQTWSLIVELHFYLCAFVFFLIVEKLPGRKFLEWGLLVFSVLAYLYVWQTNSYFRFFGGLQWAPFFALGISVFFLKRDGAGNWFAIAALVVTLVLALHQFHNRYVGPREAGLAPMIIMTVMIFLFFWLVSPKGPRVPRVIDRPLGDMTYMLFLFHYPIMKLFEEEKPYSDTVNVLIVVVVSAVGTVVLHRLLDTQVDRIRDRVRGTKIE